MLLKCVHIMCNNKFLCVYMMQENIFVCLHDKVDFFICVCILQIRICAIKHCDVEIGGNQNTHRKSLSDMSQLPSHEITSSAIKKVLRVLIRVVASREGDNLQVFYLLRASEFHPGGGGLGVMVC